MTKKRGGQANNKNAYKHGFYSKHFNDFENKALSEIPLTDVTDVIDLMRVSTGRFLESYATSLEELDYEAKHAAYRSISMAAGNIASLVRIQVFAGKNARTANEINEEFMKIGKRLSEEGQHNEE